MTCRLRWYVEMETRCRIPIWRTFGRIQWHVIPEPRITLQGAATWWIHCHDSRATFHIAGCSHLAKSTSWSCHIRGCKNSIRHIENRFSPYFIFLFLMQFRLWRAVAFASSPIHLLFWKLPQIRTYNFHKVLRQYTDAKYYMSFVGNLLLFPAVEEFWKSVKNWQSYRHEFGVLLFWTQCSVSYISYRWNKNNSYLHIY